MNAGPIAPALIGDKLHKTFHNDKGIATRALDNVSLEVRRGALTALVGPDGAGKTTLMRLAAGLMTADSGELSVLGIDVAAAPQQVQDRIGYMPQRFGLYEDLSVQQNLDLYADLRGIGAEERRERYPQLMEMTALGPFVERLAGRLSGGMKQKLGLACTLIRSPELLILDEPTVGVDPLSRRELWEIILQLVNEQGLTVLLSTSYLDEAERCGHVVVLHEGKMLAQGHPDEARKFNEAEMAPWYRQTGLAIIEDAQGNRAASDAALAELLNRYSNNEPATAQIAEVYAHRGDIDSAFKWLERGFAQRDPGLRWLKIDPLYASLRGDPRYKALLKKLGLPET